ncbi:MAG: ROK family protein [Hyphomicrobiaceae bacterium]
MARFDIVCDLGGTNVRFAVPNARCEPENIATFAVSDFDSFEHAYINYCERHANGERPEALAIGAAGPIIDRQVRLTNAPWSVDSRPLGRLTGSGRICLVNDLQAVARAIPGLGSDDCKTLRKPGTRALDLQQAPAIAINVGTGFGAASVHCLPTGRPTWFTVATEAGHMTLSSGVAPGACSKSIEDLLSGGGITRRANECSGEPAAFKDAADVFARSDLAAAQSAIAEFGTTLGAVTRNLILAHGAWAGAYLVGGVVDEWLRHPYFSDFEEGFAIAGPMAERLAAVPIQWITQPQPALVGLAHVLAEERQGAE